ncbi:MAG: hypothetical protein IJ324_02160 [Lachnospiraceae bacterium]|nr:hypothetical protein [Lachnospiraceae bacterium]
MGGYWVRHRLFLTVVLCIVTATITGLLFAFPYVNQQANDYNSQSIYKNTDIDFIVPEPSFEQVDELTGEYGIDKVFPYFLTKTQVNVNGKSRTTTVLLSDQMQNIDITMYNTERLIEKADMEYDNPILVDWQFCHDTSANIGDTVLLNISGNVAEYNIYAIYETNSIYDGGAILAVMSDEQKESINQASKNNGYSGMYISANDYNACQAFLTTDYRPLARLKNRELFDSEEQYQVHYDAIMSSGYANEITDFRIRENGLDTKGNLWMLLIGAGLAATSMIIFNIVMGKRGCEKNYFTKHCIPKGQEVRPYYSVSFCMEMVLFCVFYAGVLVAQILFSDEFIPQTVLDAKLLIIPVAVLAAGFVNVFMNYSMVTEITKRVKVKSKE